jgi:hypothetical protein
VPSNSDTGANGTEDGEPLPDHQPQDGSPVAGPAPGCTFCGGPEVSWTHSLAASRVQFHRFGQGHPMPSSWTLCDSCERLYSDRDDDRLIALMKTAGGWLWQGPDVEDVLRKPIDVFREADLGRRFLG